MRPAETLKHGTTLTPVVGGFRIRWADGSAAARVAVRLRRDRSSWLAFVDSWDGFSWNRDRVIDRPTIAELERAVRQYAVSVDEHAYVATGACHN
jgi:hypothetical protein